VEPCVIEDAAAAAALMSMTNIYYRFRHMIGKPSYSENPARLRMNRLAKPTCVHGAEAPGLVMRWSMPRGLPQPTACWFRAEPGSRDTSNLDLELFAWR
jgi:hypothetical protein